MKGWSGGGKEERVVSGDGQDLEQNIYHTEIIAVDEQISGTATGDTRANDGSSPSIPPPNTHDWRQKAPKNCKVFSMRREDAIRT